MEENENPNIEAIENKNIEELRDYREEGGNE